MIGIDHLAFLMAMGVVVGMAGLSLAVPFLFIAACAVGVALHVNAVTVPVAEVAVAASVLIAGALIAYGRRPRVSFWLALFAVEAP